MQEMMDREMTRIHLMSLLTQLTITHLQEQQDKEKNVLSWMPRQQKQRRAEGAPSQKPVCLAC